MDETPEQFARRCVDRALAYGAKFVLALGVGGITVHVAGQLFDATGGFDLLFVFFGVSALLATLAAFALPGESRTQPAT